MKGGETATYILVNDNAARQYFIEVLGEGCFSRAGGTSKNEMKFKKIKILELLTLRRPALLWCS
jgi:hypothetical protein